MVARGDLGVEIDPFQVPLIQRRLVDACNAHAKPVIVATQMLESMVESSVPTRAEVADVAGAVWDGADAVMLSEETAVGRYPVEAVGAMARAARAAESGEVPIRVPGLAPELVGQVPAAIGRAACQVAQEVGAQAIVCATVSGWTARLVAAFRPPVPVVAATPREEVARRLAIVWGVVPIVIAPAQDVEGLARSSLAAARQNNLLSPGDRAVFTAGLPFWQPGTTNLVRVIEV
jgi:pyruvate kinase